MTHQTSSAGDKSDNKGKVGVPDPIGVRERTMSLLPHAHPRAKGIELVGWLSWQNVALHHGTMNLKMSLGKVLCLT